MNGVDVQIKQLMNELVTSAPASIPLEDVHVPDRQPRGRAVVAAAALCLVLVGLAAIYAVRPGVPREPVGSDAPGWFRDVAGLLPESYGAIAIAGFDETNVRLAAIDVTTGTALEMRVSRVPIEADPSGSDLPHFIDSHGEWFEFDDGANLVTLDGRQAQVSCVALSAPETRCSEVPGYSLDREQLRDITVSLAETLTSARLADWPSPTPVAVTVEQVDAAVAGLDAGLDRTYTIPLDNGFTVAYSIDGVTEALRVSITTGYIGIDADLLTINSDVTVALRAETLVVVTRPQGSEVLGADRIVDDLFPAGS